MKLVKGNEETFFENMKTHRLTRLPKNRQNYVAMKTGDSAKFETGFLAVKKFYITDYMCQKNVMPRNWAESGLNHQSSIHKIDRTTERYANFSWSNNL